MNKLLSTYGSLALLCALSGLMCVTRGNHFISPAHLPDASWAIFFLVGFYFRQRLLLPLFLAQAALVDYLAITQFGASSFCVTPAYAFLIPAYGALWAAGRWSATHLRAPERNAAWLAASAFAGTLVCELVSSGSFYFLGGRFEDTSLREFGTRLAQYFPGDLGGVALYLGSAALLHLLIAGGKHHSAHLPQ